LDVLPGAEGLPRTGEHKDLGLRIDGEFGQRVVHLEMKLRAHGVALVRPVHDQPGDAVLLLDQHRVVFLRGHCCLRSMRSRKTRPLWRIRQFRRNLSIAWATAAARSTCGRWPALGIMVSVEPGMRRWNASA